MQKITGREAGIIDVMASISVWNFFIASFPAFRTDAAMVTIKINDPLMPTSSV